MRKVAIIALLSVLLMGSVIAFATPAKGLDPIPPVFLPKRTNCVADSQFSGTFPASNACDGNAATNWFSAATGFPHWLIVDLSAPSRLSYIQYVQANGGGETFRVDTWNMITSAWETAIPATAYTVFPNATVMLPTEKITNAVRLVYTASSGAAPGTGEVWFYGYTDTFVPSALSVGWLIATANYQNLSYNNAHSICFLGYVTGGKMWYNTTLYYGDLSLSSHSFQNTSLVSSGDCHSYLYPGVYNVFLLASDLSSPKQYAKSEMVVITIVASASDCGINPDLPGCPVISPANAIPIIGLLVLLFLGTIWIFGAVAGTILRTGFFLILGGVSGLAFAFTAWTVTSGEIFSSTLLLAAAVLTLARVPFMSDREEPLQ